MCFPSYQLWKTVWVEPCFDMYNADVIKSSGALF